MNAVALFPVISSDKKDDTGSESYNPEGLVQQTVKAIKTAVQDIVVITDVALDPFTTQRSLLLEAIAQHQTIFIYRKAQIYRFF